MRGCYWYYDINAGKLVLRSQKSPHVFWIVLNALTLLLTPLGNLTALH